MAALTLARRFMAKRSRMLLLAGGALSSPAARMNSLGRRCRSGWFFQKAFGWNTHPVPRADRRGKSDGPMSDGNHRGSSKTELIGLVGNIKPWKVAPHVIPKLDWRRAAVRESPQRSDAKTGFDPVKDCRHFQLSPGHTRPGTTPGRQGRHLYAAAATAPPPPQGATFRRPRVHLRLLPPARRSHRAYDVWNR